MCGVSPARSNMTFAEPYVLLAQIYWGNHYGNDGLHVEKAIGYLKRVVELGSARREFWTNLGMLMYGQYRDGEWSLS